MKRLMIHSMFAAAALVAGAGSASAQMLTAEIPFAFRASDKLMQPGSYDVVRISSSNAVMYSLRNRDTNAAVLLSTYGRFEASKPAAAKLAFECGDSRCALHELWTGGASGYRFFVPKTARGEMREIALSRNPNKAD
jgi:hypothetical protein